MLQGVAALKLKDNLYCLSSIHRQSNKHIFWSRTQSVPPQKLDGRLSHTSVNTPINPIFFNLCINHIYVYNNSSKTCYCTYLDV